MNPVLARVLAVLGVVVAALGTLVRREASLRAEAGAEAIAAASRLASARSERAGLEATLRAIAADDLANAEHLRAWGTRDAARLPVGDASPEDRALLVTGRGDGAGSLATSARNESSEWVDLEIAGPLGSLVGWVGFVESTREPAAWREVHFRPGLRDVRLRATLVRPVDLP